METTTPLTLAPNDWEEIYYAISSKIHYIESGKYGVCSASTCADWATHLRQIRAAIGVDGRDAAKRGVAPAQVTT